MLHPNQFQVDEAWIAFRLNDVPVTTEEDGSFNIYALMDAASCFIFGAELVALRNKEPPLSVVKRLLKSAENRGSKLPTTLFLPRDQFEKVFPREAERRGISIVRVDEHQLLPFIGEAREGYRERFTEGNAREA